MKPDIRVCSRCEHYAFEGALKEYNKKRCSILSKGIYRYNHQYEPLFHVPSQCPYQLEHIVCKDKIDAQH